MIARGTIPRLLSSPPGRLTRWAYRQLPLSARQRRLLARLSQRLLSPVVVERHLASVPEEVLLAAFPESGPPRPDRVLFVDRFLPTPDRMASGLRTFHLVRIARELGAEVTFASAADREGHRGIAGDGGDGVDRYLRPLAELGVPVVLGERALLTHLGERGREVGLVLLAWPDLTAAFLPLVRALAPGAAVVYDTVDLHGLRIGREAALKRSRRIAREAERYRRLEALIAASADLVIAVSEVERETIRQQLPEARVEVIPVPHEVEAEIAPAGARSGLLFLGQFLNTANEDGFRFLVREVFPLVRTALPSIRLTGIGSSMEEVIGPLRVPGVDCLGYRPDVAPFLRSRRVFVAPLRFGAGVKGKIGHAMSFGLPVVTTRIGSEGMGLTPGEDVLLADTPAEFADATVRLATDDDLWGRISAGGLRYVARECATGRVRETFAGILAAATAFHASWEEKLRGASASDLARRRILLLGEAWRTSGLVPPPHLLSLERAAGQRTPRPGPTP